MRLLQRLFFCKKHTDMKKKLVVILFLLVAACPFFSSQAKAQYHYEWGVGVKFGSPWASINAKHFLNHHKALEGLLHLWGSGVGITGLYERHFMIDAAPGLRWYLGGGVHTAIQGGGRQSYNPYSGSSYSQVYLGVDGVIGLEYSFEKYPLALALDASPLLNIVGGPSFWWNTGFAIRYTF